MLLKFLYGLPCHFFTINIYIIIINIYIIYLFVLLYNIIIVTTTQRNTYKVSNVCKSYINPVFSVVFPCLWTISGISYQLIFCYSSLVIYRLQGALAFLLPSGHRPPDNPAFFVHLILDLPKHVFKLVSRRFSKLSQSQSQFAVNSHVVHTLCFRAFHVCLKRKQSQYKELLKYLERALRR